MGRGGPADADGWKDFEGKASESAARGNGVCGTEDDGGDEDSEGLRHGRLLRMTP